jgi:hypothetical protein
LSWNLPDGQCQQFVSGLERLWPEVHTLYLPAEHAWHVLPLEGWYRPTAQSVQPAAPGSVNWPAAQVSQSGALYVVVYLPGGQAAHSPLRPRKLPGGHAGVGPGVGLAVGDGVGAGVCTSGMSAHCAA